MIMRLTLVSEEDYPALKCICERSVTGDNYQDYLQRLLERREDLEKSGADVLIVPMSPDAFVAHFEERRKATWPDLMCYAQTSCGDSARDDADVQMVIHIQTRLRKLKNEREMTVPGRY